MIMGSKNELIVGKNKNSNFALAWQFYDAVNRFDLLQLGAY